jgi:hypothetical protein
LISYEEVRREKVELPKRSKKEVLVYFPCENLIGLPKCSCPGLHAIALCYARSRSKPA